LANEKRWLKSYDEGVPHSLEPYPVMTLVDYVDNKEIFFEIHIKVDSSV
jgi:hypothetical protein